jgi:ABC-type antimicrobial peptide transport system permease subunit
MIYMIIREIFSGFGASFRRNPLAVALLWLGLSASTVGVIAGFAAASFSLQSLRYLLPGNLENLLYVDIGIIERDPLIPTTPLHETSIADLQTIINNGLAEGFFMEITGRSVMTSSGEAFATQVMYSGKTALQGGLISVGLQNALIARGVAVNASFSQKYQVHIGDIILLNPWTSLVVTAIVGPQPLLDRQPTIYIPAEIIPNTTIDASVGFYLPYAVGSTAYVSLTLTTTIQQLYKGVFVQAIPGLDVHRFSLRELRTVTAFSIFGALIIALVGFINAGSLISYWVLRRLPGLVIRRTIGIPNIFLWLSLVADNLAIGVSATVTGAVIALLLASIIAPQIPVHLLSVFAGICLMLVGTITVSVLLARTAFRLEPGIALRRSV